MPLTLTHSLDPGLDNGSSGFKISGGFGTAIEYKLHCPWCMLGPLSHRFKSSFNRD
jgi:hypothetical protein